MRFFGGAGAGLLAALSLAGSALSPMIVSFDRSVAVVPRVSPKLIKAVRRQRIGTSAAAPIHRRSKNPKTKRKLKPNRLHVSRRVRRKHRRAA